MIKILFYIDSLTGGGAEKVLRTLVNNLDQQVFDITVQTTEKTDPGAFLVPGIRYKSINHCKTRLGKKLMDCWIRLCAEGKLLYPLYIRGDYDIEVAYLECAPTKFLAASTNRRALKLAWVHCDLEKKEGMVASREKLLAQYTAYDRIVCVSENVRDSFIRLFGMADRALVLHNVNDEDDIRQKAVSFIPEKHSGTGMVAVGRLARQKGFDRLLSACALLKQDGYDFRLQILGEGPERIALEQQIREEDLDSYVELLGFQKNPYPYLDHADLVVCSSRYEGLSTVVTEALILGKAVVTTPCTGMRELLGDSEFGLIADDSAEGIYRGLKAMLDDPKKRESYAQAAKKRGMDFSKAKVLEQTQRFFQEQLHCKRG